VSLVTSISKTFPSLKIDNFTFDPFGHFIQDITSFKDVVSRIFLPSAFKTISPHFKPAFSEGDQGIGEIIFKIQGFSIST
jgi:hypothetical protein